MAVASLPMLDHPHRTAHTSAPVRIGRWRTYPDGSGATWRHQRHCAKRRGVARCAPWLARYRCRKPKAVIGRHADPMSSGPIAAPASRRARFWRSPVSQIPVRVAELRAATLDCARMRPKARTPRWHSPGCRSPRRSLLRAPCALRADRGHRAMRRAPACLRFLQPRPRRWQCRLEAQQAATHATRVARRPRDRATPWPLPRRIAPAWPRRAHRADW